MGIFHRLLYKLKNYIHYILFKNVEDRLFNIISTSVLNSEVVYKIEGEFRDRLIVGAGSGPLLIESNGAKRLFGGHTYGISKNESKIYIHQDMAHSSRIIAIDNDIQLLNNEIPFKTIVSMNTRKVHQIDYFRGDLYICDTLLNRLIIYNSKTGRFKYFYPKGKLFYGSDSGNYMHLNSVFITNEKIILLAHNKTTKTTNPSEILTFDKKSLKLEDINKIGVNCHNVVLYDKSLYYCDSMNGALICNDNIVFKDENYFTRGLAITDENIFVGGSEFADREDRRFKNGKIFILNHDFKKIGSITLNAIGSLQEIRSLKFDYALSEHYDNSFND